MSETPTTAAPVCYRHPSRETWVRCTRCERPICPDCMREASVGFQCPECVAQGARTQRPARTAFGGGVAGRNGYVTKTLIALNVVVMLVSIVSARGGDAAFGGGWGGLLGGSTPLTRWGAVLGYASYSLTDPTQHGVAAGEYYRLFTAMFIHYGILHLALNMWALWVLGRNLEYALGPLRFAVLYVLAGLGGNVAAYLLAAPNGETAGASTAIFGLFAAIFIVLRKLGRDTSAIIPILIINLVFTFTVSAISWQGHIGGLIVGGIVAVIMAYAPRSQRNLVQFVGCALVFVALIALTFARTASLTA
ncbi:MAG TPA: rhomboid family intramembrane serine protease [Asanoa sp.]